MSNIYRAYHAIQGLTNKQGLPTNAVFGFTNMLRKLIEEEKPDYLGVAIDVPVCWSTPESSGESAMLRQAITAVHSRISGTRQIAFALTKEAILVPF